MACSQTEPHPADDYQLPTQQVPGTSPQQNPNAELYLRQAQYYQQLANSALDNANNAMRQANYALERANEALDTINFWGGDESSVLVKFAKDDYARYMSEYSDYLELYQFYMENYTRYQQLANDYLLKAQ
jgi:hypothetical protein